jgi:hypothetical protein
MKTENHIYDFVIVSKLIWILGSGKIVALCKVFSGLKLEALEFHAPSNQTVILY